MKAITEFAAMLKQAWVSEVSLAGNPQTQEEMLACVHEAGERYNARLSCGATRASAHLGWSIENGKICYQSPKGRWHFEEDLGGESRITFRSSLGNVLFRRNPSTDLWRMDPSVRKAILTNVAHTPQAEALPHSMLQAYSRRGLTLAEALPLDTQTELFFLAMEGEPRYDAGRAWMQPPKVPAR